MRLKLLALHRKESYPGQYAPEIVSVADEVCLDENPAWWEEEVEKWKRSVGDEASAWAELDVDIDRKAVDRALYPQSVTIKAVVRSGLEDGDPFVDLFDTDDGTGMFGIPGELFSIRTFNLTWREGVRTVGDLLALTVADVESWRNHKEDTAGEIAAMQTAVEEARKQL